MKQNNLASSQRKKASFAEIKIFLAFSSNVRKEAFFTNSHKILLKENLTSFVYLKVSLASEWIQLCAQRGKPGGSGWFLMQKTALVLVYMEVPCRKGVQGYCLPWAELSDFSSGSCALHGTRKGREGVMALPIAVVQHESMSH